MSRSHPWRPGGGSGHEHPFGPLEAAIGMGVLVGGLVLGTVTTIQEAGRQLDVAFGAALGHGAEALIHIDASTPTRAAISAGAVAAGAAMTVAGIRSSPEQY